MFDLEQQIKAWRSELTGSGINRPEVLEELEDHLRGQVARLINSGSTEEAAFQNATQKLGSGKILNQEFSKAERHGFWSVRSNSLALTIITVWFVVMGLESLSLIVRPLYWDLKGLWPSLHFANLNLNWLLNWPIWFWVLSGFLQIFIGIGLLRRKNGWRIAALAMAFYRMCLIPFFVYNICFHYETWFAPTVAFEFMGLRLPLVFIYIFPILIFAMAFWAVYLLTKSTVRNQFRPATTS